MGENFSQKGWLDIEMLSMEVVESLSRKVFTERLDVALSAIVWLTCGIW